MNRIKVEKDSNFTVISNYISKDQRAGLEERGLYFTIMTLPDSWDISINGLKSILPCGRDKVGNTIKKLIELGYCKRTQCRENGKLSGYDYTFYEIPQDVEKPFTDLPYTEKPFTVNPIQLNTKQLNKDLIKEETIKEPLPLTEISPFEPEPLPPPRRPNPNEHSQFQALFYNLHNEHSQAPFSWSNANLVAIKGIIQVLEQTILSKGLQNEYTKEQFLTEIFARFSKWDAFHKKDFQPYRFEKNLTSIINTIFQKTKSHSIKIDF